MTKFTSPGSGRQITPAQYLSEYMVERQAKKRHIHLPKAYWQRKYRGKYAEWIKVLNAERLKAQGLLKVYDVETILNTLKSNDWIVSLFVRRLETLMQEEQRKRDIAKEIDTVPVETIENTTDVPVKFGKKSKRSKLRD